MSHFRTESCWISELILYVSLHWPVFLHIFFVLFRQQHKALIHVSRHQLTLSRNYHKRENLFPLRILNQKLRTGRKNLNKRHNADFCLSLLISDASLVNSMKIVYNCFNTHKEASDINPGYMFFVGLQL